MIRAIKKEYAKISQKLDNDLFVKPSNQGSYVGVHHVTNKPGTL